VAAVCSGISAFTPRTWCYSLGLNTATVEATPVGCNVFFITKRSFVHHAKAYKQSSSDVDWNDFYQIRNFLLNAHICAN